MQELISIIVPVYNGEKSIQRCVDSILLQTYHNIEIIIVNDASTDGTEKICDLLARRDSRVVVLNNIENSGVSFSRNMGIKNANGHFICFVDSDDYIQNDFCEKFISCYYKNTNGQLFLCGYSVNEENKDLVPEVVLINDREFVSVTDLLYLIDKKLLNAVWNKFFLRSIIVENSLMFKKDITLGEDLLFCLNYIEYMTNSMIFNIPEPLYHYCCISENSLSRKYYSEHYNIVKHLYSEISKTCELLGVTDWSTYYRLYWNDIQYVLLSNYDNRNYSFWNRVRMNDAIMKDKEFKRVAYIATKEQKWYRRMINRLGCFFLMLAMNKLKDEWIIKGKNNQI